MRDNMSWRVDDGSMYSLRVGSCFFFFPLFLSVQAFSFLVIHGVAGLVPTASVYQRAKGSPVHASPGDFASLLAYVKLTVRNRSESEVALQKMGGHACTFRLFHARIIRWSASNFPSFSRCHATPTLHASTPRSRTYQYVKRCLGQARLGPACPLSLCL